MLNEITGAMQSAKVMKDICQSLLTIRDASIIRERVYELNNNLIELQLKLLEAQSNQMELMQRIQTLEGEREQARQANNVMSQYKLHTFPTSSHAYVLNTDGQETPKRYFCSRCLEIERLPVTLQGAEILVCPKCNTRIWTTAPKPPRPTRHSWG